MFAAQLRKAMKERGMSASELSKATGIGNPAISQYLSGKNVPRKGKIQAIAAALDVPPEFLLADTTNVDAPAVSLRENNISVTTAAKLMGVSPQFVRIGLQNRTLPFGYAVKFDVEYRYFISARKFTECTGIEIPRKEG